MYIGYHSPTHLHSFLMGYAFGLQLESTNTEQPDFNDFHDWVAKKLNYDESTSGWAYMIEDQRKDKEEALWLFFELLDEFREINHATIATVEYSRKFELETDWGGYNRQKKIRGTFKAIAKPRPARLLIRKMDILDGWHSIVALNSKNEILDVSNFNDLDTAFNRAQEIFAVDRKEWKQF